MSNKYQHFNNAQAELDFHNRGPMTNQQIVDLADKFIHQSASEGCRTIAIITGVGIHSKNGPVIKPLIEDLLRSHPLVLSFAEGKFAQGGQGMFKIKLL
ncbi:Smr/MutS family protein [Patescibacteria group bacterium]|nr:Smr/MutS family protein [Patescibacteria group bacterium]